ncbi:carboxylate-amine ligase [Paractinoplanes atraurantiacus]|uniref:Putative glutamate--cysteine ligase 2 n=1 Tax=Paractinoplanes atraurantiacus TaxID=1036182 RepID=A0A285JG82_9ACTN|nr:glutamate--cysteine ligase [Actinoplanes atraurantiacus]SNY59284.1 carboxylate-amine ligase [Actinoplanes atraurantiacus]
MMSRRPPTFGVEEEFLLLDPVRGCPVPAAASLLRLLRGETGPHAEIMRYQLETATRVCQDAGELRGDLERLRRLASGAARASGCRLVAAGTSPYGTPALAGITDDPRYHGLARRYPALIPALGTCATHVHVGVRSRDLGVQVLGRLRPWLPTLLALNANSPLERGEDTGWASRRYLHASRWPTARPPSVWSGAQAYDRAIRKMIERGAAMDERSVYMFARLFPRYPTVEIRIADVSIDVDTAVLLAVLIRALVATAVADSRAGRPMPRPGREAIRSALDLAARHGLTGPAIDPWTGVHTEAARLLTRLVDHVSGSLAGLGDDRTVERLLAAIEAHGTGADRQRSAWLRSGSPTQLVAELAATTWPSPSPDGLLVAG